MQREGRLFSNTVLLGITSAISKAITFLMLPLYTAALTPAEFGVADILVSTAVLLLPVVSLHAPEAVFRFRAGGECGALSLGSVVLLTGLGIFAALLPLAGLLARLRPYLFLLYAYVAASVLRSFLAHVLRSDGAFVLYAVQQLFCTVLTVLFQFLLLVVWQKGVRGYLLATILADAITFLLLFSTQIRRFLPDGAIRRELFEKMARFALPMIPAGILWWMMSISDRYLILLFSGEAATGLYAAAARLPGLLTLAMSVFLESWQYAAVRTAKEERGALFGHIYGMLLPALFAIGALLTLCSHPLVTLLLAPGYGEAVRLVPLLCFGALCGALANFLGSIYTLRLRSGAALLTGALAALGNVLLNILLVPRYGALGAALSTAISYAALLALRLWHTRALLAFPRRLRTSVPALLSLFLGALFWAWDRSLCGILFTLASVLPMIPQGLVATRFLWHRLRVLLKNLRKKREF